MLTIPRPIPRLVALLVAASTLVVVPAAPGHAAFPGGNGKIVFASNIDGDSEIYTMNDDGSDITQLTFNTASDSNPTWSPDGRRIAFDSNRGGTSGEIFTMRASGARVRKLTNSPGQDVEPTWSPDGMMVAFASDRGAGDFNVFTMGSDGHGERRRTRNTADDRDPAWSPSGKLIAFESARLGTDHIFVMRPDGRRVRRVTPSGISASYDPAWSPNGRWLAFAMDDGSPSGYELWKSKVDGSGLMNLSNTGSGVDDAEPAWSPRGDKIVYMDNLDGDREIVVMNSNGSSPLQLTFNTADDRVPDWQPR